MSIFDHGPMLSKDRLSVSTIARREQIVKLRKPVVPVKRDLLYEEYRAEIKAWREAYRARPVEPTPPPTPEMLAAIALVEQSEGLVARVFAMSKHPAPGPAGPVENYRKPGTRRVVAGPHACRRFGDR